MKVWFKLRSNQIRRGLVLNLRMKSVTFAEDDDLVRVDLLLVVAACVKKTAGKRNEMFG